MAAQFYNISTEVEAQVGALLCIFNGDIEFTYSYTPSNHENPPEEHLTVFRSTLDNDDEEPLFYIDGEEVGKSEAYKYYKTYVEEHYEERHPANLGEFMLKHLEAVADDRAGEHIQSL